MSYGLYVSNGIDGAVITNGNNILNQEIFEFSGTLAASQSQTVQINDIHDSDLMCFTVDEGLDSASIQLSSNSNLKVDNTSLQNQLTVINEGAPGSGDIFFRVKAFRFK